MQRSHGDMRHRSRCPSRPRASRIAAPRVHKRRRTVTRIVRAALVVLLVAPLDTSTAWARNGEAPPRAARRAPPKPPATTLVPGADATHLYLKFAEGSGVRLRGGRFVSPGGAAMSAVEKVLRDNGIAHAQVRRLFSRSEDELDRERQVAESRAPRQLADLNLYYEIAVPADVSIEALCDALNALPAVELAAPAPLP